MTERVRRSGHRSQVGGALIPEYQSLKNMTANVNPPGDLDTEPGDSILVQPITHSSAITAEDPSRLGNGE